MGASPMRLGPITIPAEHLVALWISVPTEPSIELTPTEADSPAMGSPIVSDVVNREEDMERAFSAANTFSPVGFNDSEFFLETMLPTPAGPALIFSLLTQEPWIIFLVPNLPQVGDTRLTLGVEILLIFASSGSTLVEGSC